MTSKLLLLLTGWCVACLPLASAESPEIEALNQEAVCVRLEESLPDEVHESSAHKPKSEHSTTVAHRDQRPAFILHGLRGFMGCHTPLRT